MAHYQETGDLPPDWTEERDTDGRVFYSNHVSKSTTWDRPAAEPEAASPTHPPPFYSKTDPVTLDAKAVDAPEHGAGTPKPGHQGASGCACTPRLTFWITAAVAWIVWAFAVAAAASDGWLETDELGKFGAPAEDRLLVFCKSVDSADSYIGKSSDETICALFRSFSAFQILATIACSFSVALLLIACFRPAVGGCCSARTLVLIAGVLMGTYALLQAVSFSLMAVVRDEIDGEEEDGDDFYADDFYDTGDSGGSELGPTFGVAVTGFVLALGISVLLLVCGRNAGDGPLYPCFRDHMETNKRNAAADKHSGATVH